MNIIYFLPYLKFLANRVKNL